MSEGTPLCQCDAAKASESRLTLKVEDQYATLIHSCGSTLHLGEGAWSAEFPVDLIWTECSIRHTETLCEEQPLAVAVPAIGEDDE